MDRSHHLPSLEFQYLDSTDYNWGLRVFGGPSGLEYRISVCPFCGLLQLLTS